MNDALKLLLTDREPSEPPRHRQRADIEAQGKCLAVLQRAGHVVRLQIQHTNSPGSLFH